MKKYPNNIGEARRRYEELTGEKFTQGDAAKCFGVGLSTIRNYEQGVSLPNGKRALMMAEKYGVTVDELMGDKPLGSVEYSAMEIKTDRDELVDLYDRLSESRKHVALEIMRVLERD